MTPSDERRTANDSIGRRRTTTVKCVRWRTRVVPPYTLLDFGRWTLGTAFSLRNMWDELMTVDLRVDVPRLEMPVYYVLGRHDWNCPSELAVDYFGRLSAPRKELIWMEQSAHMVWSEEPAAFAQVLRKVLADQRASA